MSLTVLFIDSFDHYASADIGKKWDSATGVTIEASGRWSTNAMVLNAIGSEDATKNLGANYPTVQAAAAFYLTSLSGGNGIYPLFSFAETGTSHVTITIDNAGQLQARLGYANSTVITDGTATGTYSAGVWYHVEVRVTIGDSPNGSVKIWVNGTNVLDISGKDTQNGGTANCNQLMLGEAAGSTATGAVYIDDLIVGDASSGGATETWGDCRVQALLPSGNGASSQWVGSDADSTDNYALVDEAAPATADYVESSTVTDKDTYAFGNLTPGAGTIYAVQKLAYARKTEAGARSIVLVSRTSGGTEADSGNLATTADWTYVRALETTKPGGGAYAVSDVNGAQFGVKVSV